MRIAFFGLPLAAVLLDRDGHQLVVAGLVDGNGKRRLSRRLGARRIERLPDLAVDATFERVRDAAPQLIVSWFWTKPIPRRFLALAPSVGVHPSLLPRHRGADPYFWAIDVGDEVTGVTAHRLEKEYDTGPILAQRSLRIDPRWNSWALARALDRPSLALLREVVHAIASGRPPAEIEQNENAATWAPRPVEEDLAIRWWWPAARIERRVRAAAPWPGAWTEIGEEIAVVVKARATRDFPQALTPGEAAVRTDGTAVVRAGEDAIELLAGRGEDDETPLAPGDFAAMVVRARGQRGPT
jgi:methionyl-tRNA formyltransferase